VHFWTDTSIEEMPPEKSMDDFNEFDERGNSLVHSGSFTIVNKLGVHVRPATKLVKTANMFEANIFIKKNELKIDAKSILGILMLAASQGSMIIVEAEGKDAKEAVHGLGCLIEDGFGEE